MHRSRLASVVVTVVAAGAVASTANAAPFSGKVCSLLTAKQVATVNVAPLKCTAEPAVKTSIFTAYHGYWGTSLTAPHPVVLNLAINTGNASYLATAKNTLRALPGVPKKVTGIGSLAYESSGGTLTEINFAVGSYVCSILLRTTKPLNSISSFNALAKAVAAKL
jgi:hypothetical protein